MTAEKRFHVTRTDPMYRTRVPDVTTYVIHYPGVPAFATFRTRAEIIEFANWLVWNANTAEVPK